MENTKLKELERMIYEEGYDPKLLESAPKLFESLRGVLNDLDNVGRLMGFYNIDEAEEIIAEIEGI